MALKLEDLINKKKEPGSSILDLSKIKIRTKEEFEKYYDKIPEFKIRPEKVRYDDYKIRDTDFTFVFNKKEAKNCTKFQETFGDPVPPSMRSVRLEDLAAVDINWRMLTMARPNNKLEEDIFSRIVELGKLRLNTQKFEQKMLASVASAAPGSQSNANLANMGIIVSKNKRGVTETRCRVCKECGEELCSGLWCKVFPYESYTRMLLDKEELERQEAEEGGGIGNSRRASKANKGGIKKKAKAPLKPFKGKLKRRKKKGKKKNKKAGGGKTSGESGESDD